MSSSSHPNFTPDFAVDWNRYQAAIWRNLTHRLKPIATPDCPKLDTLLDIEQQKRLLLANTKAFVEGTGGNHALLWGARGSGKSSLIRALLPVFAPLGLRMVQLNVQHLYVLEELVDHLRQQPWRFILLCDDLTLKGDETHLPELKVLLEGSLDPVPDNLLLYASSNRRHLLPEDKNNLAQIAAGGELHHGDSVETTLSLADRFGLWLSFYSNNQQEYLAITAKLLEDADITPQHNWEEAAMRFARKRGVMSGRTARHFMRTLAQQNHK